MASVLYYILTKNTYMYLFEWDSYFNGISANASVLIHDYANMFDNNLLY